MLYVFCYIFPNGISYIAWDILFSRQNALTLEQLNKKYVLLSIRRIFLGTLQESSKNVVMRNNRISLQLDIQDLTREPNPSHTLIRPSIQDIL